MSAPTPKEIRDRFADYLSEWKPIREEGQEDMRFVAGDPWSPNDRKAREDASRPVISLDEINQYLNQAINNVRQNKRGIQVTPTGEGANDKDANHRENIIRGIEYRSKGQTVYITAFENAISRSYGFTGITKKYINERSFDQELLLRRFPNPDCVLPCPDFKEADGSDMEDCFVTDTLRKDDFKKKYPKASSSVSFTGDEGDQQISLWIQDKTVQVAEYWYVDKTEGQIFLIDGPDGNPIVVEKVGKGEHVIATRKTTFKKVNQLITNGLDILDEIPWQGSRVPICPCFGKEIWVDEGGGPRRKLISMVRLARDPQMLLAYLATQECEEAGMTPKAPFVGAKGQFESDQEAWELLNKVPRAYVQYDVVVDAATNTPLPAPTRPAFEPNFQAYEIAKDSARRSIQAAMGISPLPTAAQRDSEKSGVALEKIQDQENIGTFHFTDNFDMMLQNIGWQINELLGPTLDTARTVPVAKADGSFGTLRVNDKPYVVSNPEKDHLMLLDPETEEEPGEYDVTVSTGPSYQSQREQAAEFADFLIENAPQMGIPQEVMVKLVALAIKLKDIGPLGDEMVDLLTPPDPNDLPPQAQAMIAQLQGQIQQLTQENQALHLERAGKVLEQQTKQSIAKLQEATKLIVAEMQASKDADKAHFEQEMSRLGFVQEQTSAAHDAAHETAITLLEQQHEQQMAAQQQAHERTVLAQQGAQDSFAQGNEQQAAQQAQASDQVHQSVMADKAAKAAKKEKPKK